MPIGDLLAEITGQKPASASTSTLPPPANRTTNSTGLKRKADGESNSNGVPNKAVKQSHPVSRDTLTSRPSPLPNRPAVAAKPAISATNGQRPAVGSPTVPAQNKPYTGTAAPGRVVRKPETLRALPTKKDGNDSAIRSGIKSVTLGPAKVAPAKPSPTTPTAAVSAKPFKKGSMQEIMARGARAQQIAPKAGVIQHKAIGQTVMGRKEREEQKSKGRPGKSMGSSNATVTRDKPALGARNGLSKDLRPAYKGTGRPSSAGNDAPDKKIKKAAMASTGYTGTARPPSKKASDSKNIMSGSSRARPAGGLLAAPRTGRRDRYEDEDSELGDFIDDDEDEDDVAPRGYRYAEEYDSDSDMEAGADDIYLEEQRALRQAREDDAREEALLDKLKREKEAKKRQRC
ncbi:hypothetical protein BKA67DRAFT_653474 [Truncatella angustata]|uniref:SPT2 chromatin protein n=1 Tax=Truncatella angustata TaxID=152316 RepID=A0A9P8UXP6_9PEZI|nr:uncharacterized protein BKA67DRAFT_653474 [Truncatella angustata]KAH6660280.1 hypothetical protein BKA67DRAFT_653474 [Truncatella angustata]KAH8202674.1 hypothetical protein TruAng_003160 [Truncatella angustata]